MNIDFSTIKRVYMIGIGGIGMSAIARYLQAEGIIVSGYDSTATPLTQELIKEGISIHFSEDLTQIDRQADLVVYSPAIPSSHAELSYYRSNSFLVLKRSQVLGVIAKHRKSICVAGTHGKTTTSTIVAYLLREVGIGGSAFLGGISMNYGVNFWNITNQPCIIEADEYDRSFLQLFPDTAVISSMDPDHLDIYGDATTMQETYVQFSNQIKPGGILFYKLGIPRADQLANHLQHKFSYHSSNPNAYLHASDIKIENGAYRFSAHIGQHSIEDLRLYMGGRHNVENALIGIAIAHLHGADDHKIRQALSRFKGIQRRFNMYPISDDCMVIDDYAHHPEELNCLMQGVKDLFPQHKHIIVFQPHLFSRTRDFATGFSNSLSLADQVYLLDIYPARELPIEGVSSAMLLKDITHQKKEVISKEDVLKTIPQRHSSEKKVIIMAGAGNIDALVEPMCNALKKK